MPSHKPNLILNVGLNAPTLTNYFIIFDDIAIRKIVKTVKNSVKYWKQTDRQSSYYCNDDMNYGSADLIIYREWRYSLSERAECINDEYNKVSMMIIHNWLLWSFNVFSHLRNLYYCSPGRKSKFRKLPKCKESRFSRNLAVQIG